MKQTITPMVAAALAQRELRPEELRSFEVLRDDIYLFLKGNVVVRVEISSLPALAVNVSGPPETTQKVGAAETTRVYLPGVPESVHEKLEAVGYDAETLRLASQADLEAVPGIGRATARKIRQAFEEWSGS